MDYFHSRKSIYFVFGLILLIFITILFLYNTLNQAIYYATILCFFVVLVFFVMDYGHYIDHKNRLERMLSLNEIDIHHLPSPMTSLEESYQALLIEVDRRHQALEETYENTYQESVDYFTLWVHQIKTPIAALRLLTDKHFQQQDVQVQISRIEQYVEMALYYVKIDHIASDLRLAHYDLRSLVNEAIRKQAVLFIQKKITLDLQPIDRCILTDEKWIVFVIEQILSNALKYTPSGGRIEIYEHDETLYIKDTGIGIKAEDLPRLYEKGFTGYNGRVDKKASGLGLYLCQQIIHYFGYTLTITSKVKEGTCIAINFHVENLEVE